MDLSDLKSFYRKSTFLILAGILVLLLLLYGIFPWKCPIYHFFGVRCPGCGITRALMCLFKGDFADALHYNPHIYLLGLVLLSFMGLLILDKIKGSKYLWHIYNRVNDFLNRYSTILLIVCLLYIMIFTFLRNI